MIGKIFVILSNAKDLLRSFSRYASFRMTALACAVFLSGPAMACSVAPWPGDQPPTPQMIADQFLATPATFFGKVGIRNVSDEQDGVLTYTVDVIKQYAGPKTDSFMAQTDVTHSCAFNVQDDMITMLFIPEGQEQPYNLNMMSNYFYGVPPQEMEQYLDAPNASGEIQE